MQILSRSRALWALVGLSGVVFATLPSAAAAQSVPGTVLFSRTIDGTVDGFTTPIESAIFSIGDDGLHERQLTPYAKGVFNMPATAGYESQWLTNAFNPQGTYSIYLEAQSALPHYDDTPYHGKYYIVNAYGQRTPPMFFGSDDLENPNVGPSYGSVSWGPAGNDQIAYANAADLLPHKHPPCVHLMHPNGSNNRVLWCASRWYYRGIQAIRWSGDGRSLLAYALRTDPTPNPESDLYLVNATTGAATLVEANVNAPGYGAGDISYDGHEVIYGVSYDTHDPGPCNVASNQTYIQWCAKNMLTGEEVALTDPGKVVTFGFQSQALISPDGKQAFLHGAAPASSVDSEIYAVNTDGSGVRKITSPCVPMDANTSLLWRPVRLSPDGTRMLANCHAEHYPPAPVVYTNKIMIVSLADGSARFVTNGTGYDWYSP